MTCANVGTLMRCFLVLRLLLKLIPLLYHRQDLGVSGSDLVLHGLTMKSRKKNFLNARCKLVSAIVMKYLFVFGVSVGD